MLQLSHERGDAFQRNKNVECIEGNHKIAFEYGDDVVKFIVARCTDADSGGRMIDNILTNTMLPEMSIKLLEKQMSGDKIKTIRVKAGDGKFEYEFG